MSADAVGSGAVDEIDEAAQRWALGVRNAARFTEQRRRAAQEVAAANRAKLKPCGIKGCKRSGGRTGLCKAHAALVPWEDRVRGHVAVLTAQMREAEKQRRRYVRIARERHREAM